MRRFFSTADSMPKKTVAGYYAVTRGLTPGIYRTYGQVLEQITGYDHARYKKFDTYEAAYRHFFHTQHDDVTKKDKNTEEFVVKLKEASAKEKAAKTCLAPTTDSSNQETSSSESAEITPSPFCQILSVTDQQESQTEDSSNQTTVLNIEDQTLFLNFEEEEPVVSEPVRKSARLDTREPVSYVEHMPDPDNYTLEDFERDLLQIAGVCKEKLPSKRKKQLKVGRPLKTVPDIVETGEMFTKEGVPVLYTDGCCTNSSYPERVRRAGCGVFWGPRDPRNITERLWGPQTNQRAELWAVVRGVQSAIQSNYETVEIRTDSRYVVEGMNNWIHKWKKNNWKTTDSKPVKNKEMFVLLNNLCLFIDVNWVKVKGHSNDKGNDMADMLAKLGANLLEQKAPNLEPSGVEHGEDIKVSDND